MSFLNFARDVVLGIQIMRQFIPTSPCAIQPQPPLPSALRAPVSFANLSLDLVLEIMSQCVSAKHQHVWRMSRANVLMDFPISLAADSETALIRCIFQAGLCTVCRRVTKKLPYSFSLDIRICSASPAAAFSFYLLRKMPQDIVRNFSKVLGGILVRRPDDIDADAAQALMLKALPYLEGTRDAPLYRPGWVHAALTELSETTDFTSSSMMTETLQKSASRYRSRKAEVEEKNITLHVQITDSWRYTSLSSRAREHGVTFDQLVMSPTLARHSNAFARDLTRITHHAWSTMQDACLAEITWLRSPSMHYPFCLTRKHTFAWKGLHQHLKTKHPGSVPLVASRLQTCTLCPHLTHFKDVKTVKRHVETSHFVVRKDIL
ncbi:hypothetical protein B0H17DRAFT_1330260 [Mycena rosella]|uniref:Uncharacterized protein n=1 Tax=Mycena rosella TaxID=1033263 RepID=A0AAD7DLC4_MYCRO|nr:hypothetical protein B0H17DRAFT_1330260 [Mycena rosella]